MYSHWEVSRRNNLNTPNVHETKFTHRFSRRQKLMFELERSHLVDARFVQDLEETSAVSLFRLSLHPLAQHFGRSKLWIKQRTVCSKTREKRHSSLSDVFQEISGESTHWLLGGEFLRNLQKERLSVDKATAVGKKLLVWKIENKGKKETDRVFWVIQRQFGKFSCSHWKYNNWWFSWQFASLPNVSLLITLWWKITQYHPAWPISLSLPRENGSTTQHFITCQCRRRHYATVCLRISGLNHHTWC